MHVHAVYENGGEIKFWLSPKIEVAKINGNFPNTIINQLLKEISNRESECKNEWHKYHE